MTKIPHPLEKVAASDAATAAAFKELRAAISGAGKLSHVTTEYILLAGFATTGSEDAVKIHAGRLSAAGEPVGDIKQCVLVLFGATMTLVDVSRVLGWIDEVVPPSA